MNWFANYLLIDLFIVAPLRGGICNINTNVVVQIIIMETGDRRTTIVINEPHDQEYLKSPQKDGMTYSSVHN